MITYICEEEKARWRLTVEADYDYCHNAICYYLRLYLLLGGSTPS
jgi:hypothetical protein